MHRLLVGWAQSGFRSFAGQLQVQRPQDCFLHMAMFLSFCAFGWYEADLELLQTQNGSMCKSQTQVEMQTQLGIGFVRQRRTSTRECFCNLGEITDSVGEGTREQAKPSAFGQRYRHHPCLLSKIHPHPTDAKPGWKTQWMRAPPPPPETVFWHLDESLQELVFTWSSSYRCQRGADDSAWHNGTWSQKRKKARSNSSAEAKHLPTGQRRYTVAQQNISDAAQLSASPCARWNFLCNDRPQGYFWCNHQVLAEHLASQCGHGRAQ